MTTNQPDESWTPTYSKWRHGGWYVQNVRYASGAIGCVSNNYPDGKWRIACDDRRVELGGEGDYTFPTRDAAARAEYALANQKERSVEESDAAKGWKEAAIAWSVCASIHQQWAKGKDALYTTRHADFERHAENARKRYAEIRSSK